jgi:hypothetical protein
VTRAQVPVPQWFFVPDPGFRANVAVSSILRPVQHPAAALVELPAAVAAAKAPVTLRRAVLPLRSHRGAAFDAVHSGPPSRRIDPEPTRSRCDPLPEPPVARELTEPFQVVHNARRRGKALLGSRVAALVT